MHCGSKVRFFFVRIWLISYFLRAVVNIPQQTLVILPWLLFRKMRLSSQLEWRRLWFALCRNNLHKKWKYYSFQTCCHTSSEVDCLLLLDCHSRIIFSTRRLYITARKCEYTKNVPYSWNEAGYQLHRFNHFISTPLLNLMFRVCTLPQFSSGHLESSLLPISYTNIYIRSVWDFRKLAL